MVYQLLVKIESNHPETLAYDPATGIYNPNWTTTPLSLTPNAYVVGRSGDIIATATNKVWKYRKSGETDWTVISNGTGGFTINSSSVLGFTGHALFDNSHLTVEFKFSYTYHDSTLNMNF